MNSLPLPFSLRSVFKKYFILILHVDFKHFFVLIFKVTYSNIDLFWIEFDFFGVQFYEFQHMYRCMYLSPKSG